MISMQTTFFAEKVFFGNRYNHDIEFLKKRKKLKKRLILLDNHNVRHYINQIFFLRKSIEINGKKETYFRN